MAYFFNLCFKCGSLIVNASGIGQNLAQVNRHHGDATGLHDFLAGTAGVEAQGTCTNLSDAGMGEFSDHAAHGSKLVDVFHQQVAVDGISVQCGVGERNAILIEVVAHRNLATEGIAAAVQVNLVVLIVAGLHQYRHMQFGTTDGIDDADFEAEVGQRHDDAVNLVSVLAEEGGTFLAVFQGFHRPTGGGVTFVEYHIAISCLVEFGKQGAAHVDGQF